MRRRALLGAVGSSLVLAGCTGRGSPGSPDSPSTPTTPTLTGQDFTRTGNCDDPGSATVSFPDDVVVTGCISGPDGCAEAALDSVEYDTGDDVLRVAVGIEDTREPDEVCTQAIVYRSYELRATFEGGLPGTVVVVHDGVEGEIEAARVDR